MKLTQTQINHLYQFTKQHYVEWYDLQTELVDHLANAIEEQWQQNPKLTFEDALQIEFKKFGVCGFLDVVEERRVALHKKYKKLVWKHFKTFFTLPKIIVTFIAVFILFKLLLLYDSTFIILISLFVLLTFMFWFGVYKMFKNKKKHEKLTGKKWLFSENVSQAGSFGGLSFLPLQVAFHFYEKFHMSQSLALFISISIVCFGLLYYVCLYLIPSKAEEYLKATYPEYELANTL